MSNSTSSKPTPTSEQRSGDNSKHAVEWQEGESYQTGSEVKRQRMTTYVEWLLTPPARREPSTKTALAEQLGVHLNTLLNYDREPYVQREITERARASFKMVGLTEVLGSLRDVATGKATESTPQGTKQVSGSARVAAAKTLLEWVDKTNDIRTEALNLEDLTDKELMEVALQIFEKAANDDKSD